MSWWFWNSYPKTVWVAILYYTEDPCEYDKHWLKSGWYKLYTGQSKLVFNGDLCDVNAYFYFYAEASDGAVWTGPHWVYVPHTAFVNWCYNKAVYGSGKTVGFHEQYIDDNDDFTSHLIP